MNLCRLNIRKMTLKIATFRKKLTQQLMIVMKTLSKLQKIIIMTHGLQIEQSWNFLSLFVIKTKEETYNIQLDQGEKPRPICIVKGVEIVL
jgi:hypothetical protein